MMETNSNQNMASLALLISIIVFSLWITAAISLIASFLGFKLIGAIFGILSVISGMWLLLVLPYSPFLGAINLIAGFVSIFRYWR